MDRLILLEESRIRGDVYVRFGGELPITHRSNTAGRWILSLPLGSETRYLNQPKPFRIAEMYLIATEANAKIGTAAAVKKGNDALNALKKARIEGWTDATYDQEALLNEIMNERERELVGEGYRLMDLKRWGKGVKRGKPQSKGLVLFPGQASTDGLDKPVDDQRMLWPIPKTEMDANPQLAGQQNPGY